MIRYPTRGLEDSQHLLSSIVLILTNISEATAERENTFTLALRWV